MFKELLISGAIVLLSGYRYYMHKSEDIECVSYEVKSRKIPKVFDKFKIVQISDLHNRSFGIDNSILLEKIDKLKPDIVCITGDLIDGANEDFSIALKLIDELSRKYQVYHIIGNHEQKVMFNKYKELYKEYFKQLNTKNIINLENEMVKIERDSKCINIYGLVIPYKYYPYLFNRNYKNKSLDFNKYDVEKRLGKIDNREYNILLVHTPDYIEDVSVANTDLALAGHTHGGQVRVFGVAPVLNSHYGNRFLTGLAYNTAKIPLIITNGIGTSQLPIRIGAPAEVVMITLHRLTE